LTSSVGRIFLTPEEACNRQYNTHVFEWTPGEDEDELRGHLRHYIYCDNDEGIIGRLSCTVTLYEGWWREIEYNARRQKFEVKGKLAFLHGFDKEELPRPPSPTVEDKEEDDQNSGYTPYADITNDIRKRPIPDDVKGKTKITTQTTTQTQTTTHTGPRILSDDTRHAIKIHAMCANIQANLNRALGFQPRGGGGGPLDGNGGGPGGPPSNDEDPDPDAFGMAQHAQAGHNGEVKPMGALPQVFHRDCTLAEDFIEEVKNFLCLNREVLGYNSPIHKVAFTLSLLKGPKVASWAKSIGEWIDSLNPVTENIPLVWTIFLQ
jgi:hypothetical protein